MELQETTKNFYDSFKMLHPNGSFMCYCDKRRACWYIKKKLAKWINKEDKEFQLLFEPNGKGNTHLEFYNEPLKNCCVVCGTDQQLTRHHIIPSMFRTYFPVPYKAHNNHDVLMVCVPCHSNYERQADLLKLKLFKEYGGDMYNIKLTEEEKYNQKILNAQRFLSRLNNGKILHKNGSWQAIPPEALQKNQYYASLPLKPVPINRDNWAENFVKSLISNNKLEEFIILWRKHFLETAQPTHLPINWNVDNPTTLYEH